MNSKTPSESQNKTHEEFVWVFNGQNAPFPSAIFCSRSDAENWIGQNKLSGILTQYPLGISAYDWAVQNGYFNAKSKEVEPSILAKFTSSRQIHIHFENGKDEA